MSLRTVLSLSFFKTSKQVNAPALTSVENVRPKVPSLSSCHHSPISLPAWEAQADQVFENDEEWVIIPTTEQKNWETLKAQHCELLQQFKEAGGDDRFFSHRLEEPQNIKAAISELTQENHTLQTLLMHSQALHTSITLRNSLVQKLKTREYYCQSFDAWLTLLEKLSDTYLDLNKAMYYTEQVNAILHLLLMDKPRYVLFMKLAQDNAFVLNTAKDDRFIHSQAAQLFIFLLIHTYFSLYELPQSKMHHLSLIKTGEQLIICLELLHYLNSNPNALALKQGMSWSAQCQFNISVLYKAQSLLNLPFQVVPLDEVIDIPDMLLEQALTYLHQDRKMLGHRLYSMAFWQHYLIEGYKQDPTLKKTSLLKSVCDRAEQAHQKRVMISKLHKKRQKKMLNEVNDEEETYQLFVLAISEALKSPIRK